MERPASGEVFEHFKGKRYRVIGVGLDTKTEALTVIYQALYPTDYDYFTRPLSEWNEQVPALSGPPGLVPRFKKIDDAS